MKKDFTRYIFKVISLINSLYYNNYPKMINETLNNMTNSATMVNNELVKTLRTQGKPVYALGFGQSPFPPPDKLIENLKTHASHNEYLPVQGLPQLRQDIATYYSQRDNRTITVDDVVIGPGTKQLQFLLHLAMKQPEVYTPIPAWVSYSAHCKILDRKLHPIYTKFIDDWKLDDDAIKPLSNSELAKLFIFTTPNNPSGTSYTDPELQHLAEGLDKDNMVVLLDEIYSELTFTGQFTSLAKYLSSNSIISSGISKSLGAGGWRLGFLVFPPELTALRKAVLTLASETHSCATAPVQYACLGMFNEPSYQVYWSKSRKILQGLTSYCCHCLTEVKIQCVTPMGGWYLFVEFTLLDRLLKLNNINTSDQLVTRLLQDINVSTSSGQNFLQPKSDICLRLCLVDFDGGMALENCPEVINSEWLTSYCGNTIKAIEAIRNWVENLNSI